MRRATSALMWSTASDQSCTSHVPTVIGASSAATPTPRRPRLTASSGWRTLWTLTRHYGMCCILRRTMRRIGPPSERSGAGQPSNAGGMPFSEVGGPTAQPALASFAVGRPLTPAEAAAALRRGAAVEQVVRLHDGQVDYLTAEGDGQWYVLRLHRVQDEGSDDFRDISEFAPVDEYEYVGGGVTVATFDDATDTVGSAARHGGAADRWIQLRRRRRRRLLGGETARRVGDAITGRGLRSCGFSEEDSECSQPHDEEEARGERRYFVEAVGGGRSASAPVGDLPHR
jgi:hypothetical protein